MGKGLFPDEYVRSAFEIDYEGLYGQGCRGVIYDIDNTLVLPDAPADERAQAHIARLLEMGWKVSLVSNNRERRVKSFSQETGAIPYVYQALKPLAKGYRRAMRMMKTTPETTIFVGDQIYTDIWGANRAGLRTFLVQPMVTKEEPQIILKRLVEKPVLAAYLRKKRQTGNDWRK